MRSFAARRCFSKIDLMRAFHYIPVTEENIPNTTITTLFGLFEYPMMNFGLRNAAPTFQRYEELSASSAYLIGEIP